MSKSLDSLDQTILTTRIDAWNKRGGARVGDKVIMPDGSIRRLAHHYGQRIQTTSAHQPTDQRYYFGHGYCSFSGSLGEVFDLSALEDTGSVDEAPVWFFHHDQAQAFNAVHAHIPCRVYRLKGRA